MHYPDPMTQSLSKEIAKVVRGILAERRITVQEFAALMGEPNSSVARWINGGGAFKTDKLDEMADALGMDVGRLVAMAIERRTTDLVESKDISDAERAELLAAIERKGGGRPSPRAIESTESDTG